MKKGVLWLFTLALFVLVLFAPMRARAEFCPARIVQVLAVQGEPAAYAVRLAADSPRSVTGQFFLETDGGWFRAPFPPLHLAKDENRFPSASVLIAVPKPAKIENVWLVQAASDDPQWAPHGTVSCSPSPERHVPLKIVSKTEFRQAAQVWAMPVSAPLSYHCAVPFAQAKIQGDVMDAETYAPGQYAIGWVDIDAQGNVVNVQPLDASNGDFMLRKQLKDRIMHMPISPAIAYCRPVPSSYLVREEALP